ALLETDLTLAGPIIANIVTAISTTDADFVVKIIDVFPDDFAYPSNSNYPMTGYQMLVRGEIMRGKFRKSFEQPIPFKPNTRELVRFQLPDIAHTFKKGHRLMVQVQSSWFPLADRNPQQFLDIFKAKASDFIKSTVKIYEPASYIEAPIISNSAAH
ncbi:MULTISPECIES: CocE/NonD family hydrolase C-terminal non-catalytic domain-containing protein, partial [Streptomyces]